MNVSIYRKSTKKRCYNIQEETGYKPMNVCEALLKTYNVVITLYKSLMKRILKEKERWKHLTLHKDRVPFAVYFSFETGLLHTDTRYGQNYCNQNARTQFQSSCMHSNLPGHKIPYNSNYATLTSNWSFNGLNMCHQYKIGISRPTSWLYELKDSNCRILRWILHITYNLICIAGSECIPTQHDRTQTVNDSKKMMCTAVNYTYFLNASLGNFHSSKVSLFIYWTYKWNHFPWWIPVDTALNIRNEKQNMRVVRKVR
jgi:hypothetical protein